MSVYYCPLCKSRLSRDTYEKIINQLTAEKEKIIEQAVLVERQKMQKLLKVWKDRALSLRDRIIELERGVTPQIKGFEFEDELVKVLKQQFPEDNIIHKGKKGDILHTVCFNNTVAGTIIYECKRTPAILTSHIQQAYKAKQHRKADFAVLITTGKKEGFGGIDYDSDVLITSPENVLPLVTLLRFYLIQIANSKIGTVSTEEVKDKLMEYITGNEFKNIVEECNHEIKELRRYLEIEMEEHINLWKKRWEKYHMVQINVEQLQSTIQSILNKKESPVVARKAKPFMIKAD